MKPVTTTAPKNISQSLTVSPSAKIISHPLARPIKEEKEVDPPTEETLNRLNAMARQYPFCIRHRTGKNHLL